MRNTWGFFEDNVTDGDIGKKGTVVGSQVALRGSDFPLVTIKYTYRAYSLTSIFMSQSSDLAPLSVSTHRDDLHPTEEISVRNPTPK